MQLGPPARPGQAWCALGAPRLATQTLRDRSRPPRSLGCHGATPAAPTRFGRGRSLPDRRPHPLVSDRKLRSWRWGDLPPLSSRSSVRAPAGAERGTEALGWRPFRDEGCAPRHSSLPSRAHCPAQGGEERNSGRALLPRGGLGLGGSSSSPLPTPASSPSHRGGCAHGPEVQVAHLGRHTFRSQRPPLPGSFQEKWGASHSPLGLQRFVILSQARYHRPAPLHSRRLDRGGTAGWVTAGRALPLSGPLAELSATWCWEAAGLCSREPGGW